MDIKGLIKVASSVREQKTAELRRVEAELGGLPMSIEDMGNRAARGRS